MGIYLCTAELGGVEGTIFFVFHSCAFSLIINWPEAPYLSCIQSTYVRIFISQKPRKITGSKDSEVWLRFWLRGNGPGIARPVAWARSWAKQGHQSCWPGRPSEGRGAWGSALRAHSWGPPSFFRNRERVGMWVGLIWSPEHLWKELRTVTSPLRSLFGTQAPKTPQKWLILLQPWTHLPLFKVISIYIVASSVA